MNKRMSHEYELKRTQGQYQPWLNFKYDVRICQDLFNCNINAKFWENKKSSKQTGKKPSLDGEWAQVQVHAHAYVHNCTHIHIFLTELITTHCMTECNAGGRSTIDIWKLALVVFYNIWVYLNSADNKHDITVHIQALQVSYLFTLILITNLNIRHNECGYEGICFSWTTTGQTACSYFITLWCHN